MAGGYGNGRGRAGTGTGTLPDKCAEARAHLTFPCACGAILIIQSSTMLIPELICMICTVFYRPGRVEVCRQSSTILIPELKFCRDSLVPVSQPVFGIGNEQKS